MTSRSTLPATMMLCLLACALLAPASSSASTPIYSYADDSGTQHFTTELGSIPRAYRHRATQLRLDSAYSPPSASPSPAPVSPVPAPSSAPSLPRAAAAHVRVVRAAGDYPMGEHDTRADAVRMAVEHAKRDALEQVATYLESVTEVKNMEVTRDDIRSYTAGIVSVLDQHITTRLEGEAVFLHAELTAEIDPDEVTRAIAALRENESAQHQLALLRTETDHLRQQLDAANQALLTAQSPEQVHNLTAERRQVLNQMQADALVSQAWTTWVYASPVVYPSPASRAGHANGLLLQARQLHPTNRHLHAAQQALAAGESMAVLPRTSLPAPSQVPATLRQTPLSPLAAPLPPSPLAAPLLKPTFPQIQPLGVPQGSLSRGPATPVFPQIQPLGIPHGSLSGTSPTTGR